MNKNSYLKFPGGRLWPLLGLLACLATCAKDQPVAQNNRDIRDIILTDASSYFYVDTRHYPQHDHTLPIGIFDSGTGGLTVLDAIVQADGFNNVAHQVQPGGDGQRDFQGEYFIYLGDQANMPYGNYGLENNTELLQEHIFKDLQFLLGNKYYRSAVAERFETDKQPVKAVVIACNTATAYGKTAIDAFLQRAGLQLKVIGVIDAGVRGALSCFNPDDDGSIAVMATAGTVSSNGYLKAFDEQRKALGYTGKLVMFQQAGIGLAGAIDGVSEYIDPKATQIRATYQGPALDHPDACILPGLLDRYSFIREGRQLLIAGDPNNPKAIQLNSVENYIFYHLTTLLEKIRSTPAAPPLKAIILGCTHYPYYAEVFQAKLQALYDYQEHGGFSYRPWMASEIFLVDPAQNTAAELFSFLATARLLNQADLGASEFYLSVPNLSNPGVELDTLGNFSYAYKYGRRAGELQQYIIQVPFSRQTLAPEIIDRISGKMPAVYELLQLFNRKNPKMQFLREQDRL
jgi:glutamate racemase